VGHWGPGEKPVKKYPFPSGQGIFFTTVCFDIKDFMLKATSERFCILEEPKIKSPFPFGEGFLWVVINLLLGAVLLPDNTNPVIRILTLFSQRLGVIHRLAYGPLFQAGLH
jgi:hypothetical protein